MDCNILQGRIDLLKSGNQLVYRIKDPESQRLVFILGYLHHVNFWNNYLVRISCMEVRDGLLYETLLICSEIMDTTDDIHTYHMMEHYFMYTIFHVRNLLEINDPDINILCHQNDLIFNESKYYTSDQFKSKYSNEPNFTLTKLYFINVNIMPYTHICNIVYNSSHKYADLCVWICMNIYLIVIIDNIV